MVKCKPNACKNAITRLNFFTGKKEGFCTLKKIKRDYHCYMVVRHYYMIKGMLDHLKEGYDLYMVDH